MPRYRQDIENTLPPLSALHDFLSGCLIEAGPISYAEYGARALLWTELQAWQSMTQTDLDPMDALNIMAASQAYAAGISEYSGQSVNPPFAEPGLHVKVATEAELDKAFGIGKNNGI